MPGISAAARPRSSAITAALMAGSIASPNSTVSAVSPTGRKRGYATAGNNRWLSRSDILCRVTLPENTVVVQGKETKKMLHNETNVGRFNADAAATGSGFSIGWEGSFQP